MAEVKRMVSGILEIEEERSKKKQVVEKKGWKVAYFKKKEKQTLRLFNYSLEKYVLIGEAVFLGDPRKKIKFDVVIFLDKKPTVRIILDLFGFKKEEVKEKVYLFKEEEKEKKCIKEFKELLKPLKEKIKFYIEFLISLNKSNTYCLNVCLNITSEQLDYEFCEMEYSKGFMKRLKNLFEVLTEIIRKEVFLIKLKEISE